MRSRFSLVLATVSVPGTGSESEEPSGQVTPLPANHSLSLVASAAVVFAPRIGYWRWMMRFGSSRRARAAADCARSRR